MRKARLIDGEGGDTMGSFPPRAGCGLSNAQAVVETGKNVERSGAVAARERKYKRF